MYTDITGFILAGGKSSRMGTNKSFLRIGGSTVIERTAALLKPVFKDVVLITNNPEEYSFLKLPMFEDNYKNIGPLAGIHSALLHSKTEKNFIISCDIPLMTEDVIKYLIEYPTDRNITVARADNFIQQLCGVYNKNLLPVINEIIIDNLTSDERNSDQKKRGCRVLELVKRADACIIDIEKEYENYIPGTYYNMNNPGEYNYILKRLEEKREA